MIDQSHTCHREGAHTSKNHEVIAFYIVVLLLYCVFSKVYIHISSVISSWEKMIVNRDNENWYPCLFVETNCRSEFCINFEYCGYDWSVFDWLITHYRKERWWLVIEFSPCSSSCFRFSSLMALEEAYLKLWNTTHSRRCALDVDVGCCSSIGCRVIWSIYLVLWINIMIFQGFLKFSFQTCERADHHTHNWTRASRHHKRHLKSKNLRWCRTTYRIVLGRKMVQE